MKTICAILLAAAAIGAPQTGAARVKVFILAGQSNMEGKGQMKLAEYQSEAPEFRDFYRHLKKDGKWIQRDDVWINFLDRRGPLTVGYGSPNCIGPELEFGMAMGDRFEEPVLLIKTAWGGRSLGRERYGKSYREMMAEVRTTLAELGTRFPALAGREPEICGFVWFQGWNDLISAPFADAYAANLECLIRDVRKDLKTPNLPVVIGQNGQNGFKPAEGGMKKVKEAQASMESVADFKGTVKVVATDAFWDADADKLIATWKENKQAWDKVGSDFGYHYLGSVRTFCRIGRGFGEAMGELLGKK
jgi:alpha-galactosidase